MRIPFFKDQKKKCFVFSESWTFMIYWKFNIYRKLLLYDFSNSFDIAGEILSDSEAATQRCSQEKVFWKYAANLQENTHDEAPFQ